jgi:hypothetical protein
MTESYAERSPMPHPEIQTTAFGEKLSGQAKAE